MKEIEQDKLDEQDESLNIDESRDVDNRMCGDKIMRELRDKIIKDSLHIKDALGVSFISSDTMISREDLKNAIKKLCTPKITYDEIMKAIDHFHQVSLDKK
jgi:DNA-binding phage protein